MWQWSVRFLIRPVSQTAAIVQFAMLAAVIAGAACASSLAAPAAAVVNDPRAVRLIMVEAAGCRFCARWHAEIGPAYPKSREGQFAPLVRVGRDAPELKGLKPVTFTPTFIVMRGTAESGRIAGYPGQDYFWDELREVLIPAGFVAAAATGP